MDSFGRDGLTFDVRDSGPQDGPVVVLLHGFPQTASSFDRVTPLLVDAGLRVLAPDQRGYSPRARPAGRRAYVLRTLVDDVVALLDAAEVPAAHVVGHDWGGAVAWTVASRRPGRTLSLTALSTPHPAAMREAMRHGDQLRRSSYMAFYQLPWLPERRLLADGGAPIRRALVGSGLPADRADEDVRRLLEPGALTAALAWYRAIGVGGSFGAGRVHVPTTHLYGRDDPFFSPDAHLTTSGWVRAPFRSTAIDAGHWLPDTHPAEVADAVLARVAQSA